MSMSSTKDIKPAKAKQVTKLKNLSTALKKNLQRRKKVKKEKDNTDCKPS